MVYERKVSSKKNIIESKLSESFLKDWESCRDRHDGQLEVLNAVFEEQQQYVFYRAGRKGAKTTTAIDVAWKKANLNPNLVIYLCYPTISLGIDVVWDERRLQTCDQKDDKMFSKYVEKVNDARHMVTFSNGSFIKLIGTWSEAKGRGTQPDLIIFDEVQDCDSEYIEAMDANLAAKPGAQCLMMGTPPKKRNHYEEWWERIGSNPRGKTFHYTSYDNVKLPHLKEWLDNKKIELTKANKEDVWLREYMAELCYSSSDRVLPDIRFLEKEEIDKKTLLFSYNDRIPVVGVSVTPTYFCAILGVMIHSKMLFVTDHLVIPQIWNRSFAEMYPLLLEKVKIVHQLCGKKVRNIVWDESESFIDVISGFSKCRKDLKWQDRGTPLLRELIIKEKIQFSREIGDLALECQNMLVDESTKDVQKNYPHICTLSMLVNEFFAQEKMSLEKQKDFDKFQAFRDMGIPVPENKKHDRFFRLK